MSYDFVEPAYEGMIEGLGETFVVVRRNGETRQLVHYPHHSPTGFSWGYQGSGPAELARCLLADYLGLVPIGKPVGLYGKGAIPEIDSLYQSFKSDVISKLDTDRGWNLPGEVIGRWLEANPPRTVCATHREPIKPDEPCFSCELPENTEEQDVA